MSCEFCRDGEPLLTLTINRHDWCCSCADEVDIGVRITRGHLQLADIDDWECLDHGESRKANFCLHCGEPLTPPEPLTLEQLQEVQNSTAKQIWIKTLKYNQILPATLDFDFISKEAVAIWTYRMQPYKEKDYGKTWLAYTHKPKDETPA